VFYNWVNSHLKSYFLEVICSLFWQKKTLSCYLQLWQLKVVSSVNSGEQKIVLIVGYYPGKKVLGICFSIVSLRLVLNIFPFPFSTAGPVGDFWTKRRKVANRSPGFAWSSVSLVRAIFTRLIVEAQQKELFVQTSLMGVASSQRYV
jgi:hypothetical protein